MEPTSRPRTDATPDNGKWKKIAGVQLFPEEGKLGVKIGRMRHWIKLDRTAARTLLELLEVKIRELDIAWWQPNAEGNYTRKRRSVNAS